MAVGSWRWTPKTTFTWATTYYSELRSMTATGTSPGTWGTQGDADGEFDGVSGLVFDADDNMLLFDHRNNRVQKFTKDDRFIDKWGSSGSGDGELNLPWGISLDREGYIADYIAEGEFVAKFGSPGDGDGEFHRPSGLAVERPHPEVLDSRPKVEFVAKFVGSSTLTTRAGQNRAVLLGPSPIALGEFHGSAVRPGCRLRRQYLRRRLGKPEGTGSGLGGPFHPEA